MNGDEDAGEVQHGGQDGLDGHGGIGQTHVLRHQEGGSAHDGGHDLAAGGGGRLDSAGELRLIAGLFHHGDGDGAGGNGVAHGGAGHHAAQGGGDDRHLGGAAAGPTGNAVGKADEEVGDAGALQKRAENDEQNDVGIADVDRGADDAVGGVEQLIDDVLQRLIEVGVPAELIVEGIHQQHAHHAQNGQAHAAAAQLQQDQDTHRTDHHVDRLDTGGQLDERHGVEGEIQKAAGAHQHQHDIVPGHEVDLHVALFNGVGQEADEHDAGQKQAQTGLRQSGRPQGHRDAVQGKRRHQATGDPAERTFPDTGVGFAVIFAHHRVQIGGYILAASSGGIDCRGLIDPFFE